MVRILTPQMDEIGKIFLGNTPSDQRAYLSYLISKIKNGYQKYIVPCVGQFAIPKILIENGIKSEQIYCSDIGMFTSLIGYFYSGKNIKDMPIKIEQNYENDIEALCDIIYKIKISQINPKNYYMEQVLLEIKQNEEKYKKDIDESLKKAKCVFDGIHYNIMDMRSVLIDEYTEEDLIIINPPAFSKGYTRMFPIPEGITYNVHVDEWNLKKEFKNVYQDTEKKKGTYIWYKYKELDFINERDALFAKEYTKDRFDYWVSPSAEKLKNSYLKQKKYEKNKMFRYKIIPKNYVIKETSKISVIKASEEDALYLRDLWAHKMGTTKAEQYTLISIDKYAWGIVGFHTSEIRKLVSDEIFEVFGFNADLENHKNSNRLLMMIIMSREFADILKAMAKTNRFFEINNFKTTCISKYRKVKTNNGLLNIRDREQMKNGMYKIVYTSPIYEKTINETVREYLQEKKND